MSLRDEEQAVQERLWLLEREASLQRAELMETFAGWEKRGALAWGARIAGWGFKLFAQPKIRWLIATTLLSKLRRYQAR
jgi:hypothetical protein